jgi:hypothetical protein
MCPQCRSGALHHSRTRSWIERVRRSVTGLVPFRCYDCGWRGWRAETSPADGPREIHRDLTDDEIEQLELQDEEDRRK